MLFEPVQKDLKDIVFVYTTCSDIEEARAIGFSAVEEKLAISADYWPINSIYPWKNVIQEVDQCMLMCATQKYLGDQLVKHIESEHSYDVPTIIRVDSAMVNQPYSFWVDTVLSSKDKYISEEEYQKKKKEEEGGYQYDKLK